MTTYKEIFGKPIKVLTGDPAPTPITYTVTVSNPGSGNVYYIDGVQTPTLELYEGNTYNFDYSAATGHPFRFATAADAAGSTEYTTGVSVDSNITTIVVASGAPTLFYYCTNHSGMGGRALTPASPNEYEGQIWYNETTGNFRSIVASSAWVSSVPLPETASNGGGAGIQTAALFFGGRSGGAQKSTTSEYNGLGYSAGGAMGTARNQMGTAGTQTAALAATGIIEGPSAIPAQSEEYNGTAWTAGGSASTARFLCGGAGIQTAAIITGGRTPSYTNATEEYDGSSWTSGGVLNRTATLGGTTTGSLTAAVAFGGSPPSPADATNDVTFYDGTSWSEVNNTPIGIKNGGSGGPQTSALYFGGTTPPGNTNVATTVLFDGTNFSTSANMGSSIYIQAPAANATNNKTALSMGGFVGGGSYTAATEEFTSSANVLTAAAWSSGGSLGTGRYQSNGQNVGTKDAGLMVGGQGSYPPSNPAVTISNVEEYDGSSWSEVTNLPTTRAMVGTVGTQTAAFLFGGYGKPGAGPNPGPSSPNFDTTFNYDGSSWTSETAMPAAVAYLTGAGTQTAALSIGGYNALTACNEYDGSSWTGGGAMTTGRHNGSAFGIQTAAVIAGGAPAPAGTTTDVESYDGSSWTSAATLILAKEQGGTAGTQTDGLITLGNQPNPTNSAGYNGTAWFTQPSTSTARYGGANGGTNVNSAYYAGGGGSAPTRQVTEEFTGEATADNVKTFSTS